jgi:hypothetical protein
VEEMKTGTLKELDVKPGDVVECVTGSWHTSKGQRYTINSECDILNYSNGKTNESTFRLIPRATHEPKTWAEMTPEEKGALLLAHHEGADIEVWVVDHDFSGWLPARKPRWHDCLCYRVRPEPVRGVVTMAGYIDRGYFHVRSGVNDTHRITFDLIDGEPDCDSIKMERIT